MKHAKLSISNFIKLVDEAYVKVGRYEYERNVDKNGNSHYYRYYRKGDEIVSEEVALFNYLKIFGEYYDGNTHYWTDRKFDNDGNPYILIVADIQHEKFTEQITYKVKEL